jgi:hypothetical protein
MNNFKSVNARWIFLLPLESRLIEQLLKFRQYHYDERESSTADIDYLQSLLLEILRHRRAEKDLSHSQEQTGNVRSSFKITRTVGYKSASA